MLSYFVIVFSCTIVSVLIDNFSVEYDSIRDEFKKNIFSRLVFYGILISIILFSSLRTSYNDTFYYGYSFETMSASNISIKLLFEPYGGFELLQQLCIKYLSQNQNVLFFVCALIVNIPYMAFIRKHTENFAESMLLYLIGTYLFSMAGMKQAIAVAISLYAIEGLINKKFIKFIVFLLLAMTFHPYIICLVILPFIMNKIWDFKLMLIISLGFLLMLNLDAILQVAETIGKEYSTEEFTGNTINPLRVVVEAVPLAITFIYRNKIREKTDNPYVILFVNMQLIRFSFIFLGLFMNPVYFGRMGSYFGQLSPVSLPIILHICFDNERNGRALIFGFYLFQIAYWIADLTKIGTISLSVDRFNHISIFDFFDILKTIIANYI